MTSEKLRNNREFRKVYEQGQRFHTPYFSVFILPTEDSRQRIGYTVTRKIGNAVIRNRCKRRLREATRMYFRLSAESTESLRSDPAGFDMVLNAKSDLVGADFGQLKDAFARVMLKYNQSLKKRTEAEISNPQNAAGSKQ
jgi:ribonuclease P protein component